MTDTIQLIPLAEIDDAALTRDRTGLDPEALTELQLSIAASGLRMPVEVFRLSEPRPPHRYGLLSGLRRLHAFRALDELNRSDRYAAIPAFLRAPATMAEALAAVVEENEIRAQPSAWERGRIARSAWRDGIFPTIEEAVATLYPAADRTKRARLRSLAHLVEELDGWLTAPERLSLRQCLRLAAALRLGFGTLMRTALEESSLDDTETQWQLLAPIVAEAERLPPETSASARPLPGLRKKPRRLAHPRQGLTIRRELTRDGYTLHFTGRQATSGLVDKVIEEIERMFSPG